MPNRRQTKWMVVSSAALAVAPKCPLCVSAYFGTFGMSVLSVAAYRAWLPPLTAIWLALTVGTLAFKSGRRQYGPPALGAIAAIAVYGGKFILDNEYLVYAGIASLLGAAIRLALRRTPGRDNDCPRCDGPPV